MRSVNLYLGNIDNRNHSRIEQLVGDVLGMVKYDADAEYIASMITFLLYSAFNEPFYVNVQLQKNDYDFMIQIDYANNEEFEFYTYGR